MCETIVSLLPSDAEFADTLAGAIGASHEQRGRDFTDTGARLRELFLSGQAIVLIGAAGIAIRCLAPVISDKRDEPPVLAVAADGSAVLPLLGGHRGANALARRIADHLGIAASVTTSGDVTLGVALDAPPAGWRLENPGDVKTAMARLISGAAATLSGEADWLTPLAERCALVPSDLPDGPVVLSVDGAAPLIYRRQRFVLGVGCARFCSGDELIGLVGRALGEAGIAQTEIAAVHSIDLKADEAAIHELAAHLDVPARFHDAAALDAVRDRLANPSDIVFAEVGCHGVAEGAALVAAGPGARLTVEKHKSANATCALAELNGDGSAGRKRGQIAVVGIGPGKSDWRTPEVSRLVAEADELVGYGFYIDLLGPAARGKTRADFALGEEEARCRYALERAGEGIDVVLVCSGDGGIYAMGALVAELLARPAEAGGVSDQARRVRLVNAPGISALQAASARTGALLGHDFCTISLSDLLTRREDILKRLHAAAEGDFVIAFYNPVSRRRRTLLAEARDILLAHRPADTPVLLATSLGRPEESLRLRRLDALDVEEVDMMTVVLVGSTASRAARLGDRSTGADGHLMYTPRGYARKIDGDLA